MTKLKNVFLIFLGFIFISIFLLFFLYPIISSIYYWIFLAPQKKGEIAPAWSWGKNWCGFLIYQEKLPLEDIPSDCLDLIR